MPTREEAMAAACRRGGPLVTVVACLLAVAACLLAVAAFAEADIPIVVDGLPLDARAVAIKDEIYIPAWILENYAHTKVNWSRRGNILEILTGPPAEAPRSAEEGKIHLKVGFYMGQEGFVVGTSTRLYLLNVDPKEFLFADGKTSSDRAHEGALERTGTLSTPMKEYLSLAPIDRFSPKGWKTVSRMPKEEIGTLPSVVERYEVLYRSLYYDLLTNLVMEKDRQVNDSTIIDDALRGIRIDKIAIREDGTAEMSVPSGFYYIYGRMLYRNRQIVWDIPVAVRGGPMVIELSNRNAALMQ